MDLMPITSFSGDYEFLSNFYRASCSVVIKGKSFTFDTSEACYAVAKYNSKKLAKILSSVRLTPGQFKRLCANPVITSTHLSKHGISLKDYGIAANKTFKIRKDWDSVRLAVMLSVLISKFDTNPHLAVKLMETGNAMLVEGNHWGDNFWGVDSTKGTAPGANWLGILLMLIRSRLCNRYAP